MRASWLLIRAQIKNKKGGYISLFVLTLIIGLMLSLSLSVVVNIRSAAQDAVEASNFGDLYLNFGLDYVPTDQDFSKLNEMEEFDRVDPLKKIKVLGKPANLLNRNGEKTEVSLLPAIYEYNSNQLSLRLLSDDQKSYLPSVQCAPPKKGEAYLPILFIDLYGAALGDRYVITSENETFEFVVSGFVEDITQINMISIGEHNVYVNHADLHELEMKCLQEREAAEDAARSNPDLMPRMPEFNLTYTLHLGISEAYGDCDTEELFQRIEDATGLRGKSAFYFDDEMFVHFASHIFYLILFVILVFVIVMFIAALAILNFTIYSSIESEYRNIGVMKAVGLKNAAFNVVYLLSYPMALIAGLVTGSLCALPILKLTAPLLLELTCMLPRTTLAVGSMSAVSLVLVLICVILILWQLRGINKIKPRRVLSEGKQSVYRSSGLKIKLAKPWLNMRLSLKQFTASARTYVGSVFVIAILFFVLLVGLSTTTLVTPDKMMEDFWGFDWDIMVLYRDQDEYKELHDEVNRIIFEESEVKDSYLVYQHTINGLDQNLAVFALDEQHLDRMTSLLDGRAPQNAGEVALTKIVADSKNIKIGDDIELQFNDKKATYKVTGFFQTINHLGRSVTLTTSGLERLLGDSYDDDLTQVWYVLEDQSVSDAVREKVNLEFPDLNVVSIVETWENYGLMSRAFDVLPVIIFCFAVVFVVISSFQLAEKIFNREQIDFGIMKAIGFRNKVTRQIFSSRFAFVALIGLLLGGIVFHVAADPLMNLLANFMGLSQVNIRVPAFQALLAALAMIIIFRLVAHFISRKIARLNVRDLVADV